MYTHIHIHTYILVYYSAIKKNTILPLMLSKIRQTEKDKYCMVSLICGILKKQNKLVNVTKKRETHRYRELMVTNGETEVGGARKG